VDRLTRLRRSSPTQHATLRSTHYAKLGVAPGTKDEAIHEAYKKLALKHHPDRGGDGATFAEITYAYGVLKSSRAQYDAQLKLAGRLNCDQCGGSGLTRRQKSFTRFETSPCSKCKGTGEL
jgi:DnaJ-class molecular chaperone